MMIQAGEDDARRRSDAGDDGRSGGGRAEGDGWGGQGGDGDGAEEAGGSEWEAMMRACSEGEEGDSRGGGDATATAVGVGRARERVGPGKWRRVATLARWEPSARAHMLSHLAEGATADVTGD